MPAGPHRYAWQLVMWLDCGLNALLGGYYAETFSAHCHRCNNDAFWYRAESIVNKIFFWELNHCERAFRITCEMAGLPDAYRSKI